jgi:hypothetical protein
MTRAFDEGIAWAAELHCLETLEEKETLKILCLFDRLVGFGIAVAQPMKG